MPLPLKLRRSPDAPRLSLRDRLTALKGSAAKVMRRQPAGIARPKLPGSGTPSKALAAALAAHEMAYGYALYTEAYGLPDLAERRQAEEEAFRALLHTPLTSDADRAAYAAAVISRQAHSLGDNSATERDHPMAVAFRNIALGEHAREPEAMRHIGRKAEPDTQQPAPPPSAPFDTYDHRTGLVACADATGTARTKPVAEWVAFMAARLHHVARSERARQFNAACNDLDKAARALLEARLTRELRIDAIHALAHRSDQVFAEAQALRDGGDGAGASAAKIDLTPFTVLQLVHLHEAYKITSHVWEGVGARPYSIASRDARGCVHATMIGRLADFEETRAGLIGNRIVDEITSRSPQNERERDYILSLRLQHEIDCEGRIRDADMMREIAQAWGA